MSIKNTLLDNDCDASDDDDVFNMMMMIIVTDDNDCDDDDVDDDNTDDNDCYNNIVLRKMLCSRLCKEFNITSYKFCCLTLILQQL